MLFRFSADGLLVANTGAPLTSDGVLALSTLRASAKTGDDVGRFGVGFAAVLSVSDAPQIGSHGAPSVRWSAAETASLLAGVPSLAADLSSRGGHVPVLRLPFEAPPMQIPDGYDTAVWLPFRSPAAAAGARALVAALDPTLLLVLPALSEIAVDGAGVEPRVVRCTWDGDTAVLDGERWARAAASGALPEALLGEVRIGDRTRWSVAAFAPVEGGALPAASPRVLRAPTQTDEPLSLPVLVVASAPLEPTRRRVVRGAVASFVLARAGEAVAELAAAVESPWEFMPTGLAAGDIDAEIRAALAVRLPETRLFAGRFPRDCVVIDVGEASAAVLDLLAGEIDGLLPVSASAPRLRSALELLGVRRLDTAGVVELLAGLERPPAFWREAYSALNRAADQDALGALPVPLVDGRVVTGAAGALVPSGPLPAEVTALPLRIVHPDAVHPLLERLGARPATAASLLADPAVQQAVSEECEPELIRAVIALVTEAGVGVDDEPWLADLPLPAVNGEVVAAGDLLWPGGAMDRFADPSAGLDVLAPPDWLERDAARRLGVLDDPAVVRVDQLRIEDLLADSEDPVADLDGIEEWAQDALAADVPELAEFRGIRDLDVIADLPGFLRLVAADVELRSAVVTPARFGGSSLPSYSAWWFSRQPVLDGLLPTECALPGDRLLSGLFDAPPGDFDRELLVALGVRIDLAGVLADADGLGDLLDRLGDADRTLGRDQVRQVHAAIAAQWGSRLDQAPEPPLAVRAVLADGTVAAVPLEHAVLVDAPDQLFFVTGLGLAVVPAPASAARVLAELLDVSLGSDLDLPAPAGGVKRAVPQLLSRLAGAGPSTYRHHAELAAPWRLVNDVLHATEAGLPAGLAWAAGCWPRRHLLLTAALHPDEVLRAEFEQDLED